VPLVATEKAVRGYGAVAGLPGVIVTPNSLAGFAEAAVALHEAGEEGWIAASLSVLAHAAALDDERAPAADFAELAAALGAAADAQSF
jgi:hypothetical protein